MMTRYGVRIVSVVLTAACLLLGAYTIDAERTFDAIAEADRPLMALAAVLLVVTLGIFGLRWHQLIVTPERLSRRRAFNFMMIGYLANAILPARPGDLIRAMLLRRSQKISLSFGLASIVLERLFDLMAICVLGVAASIIVPLPDVVVSALYSVAIGGGGLVVALLLFNLKRSVLDRFRARYPQLFRTWIARFLIEWLGRFAAAIGVLYSPRRMIRAIALTCIGWVTFASSVTVLVVAFHLPAPPGAGLLVLVTTNLGAAIPSLPGSIGIYHFMAVLALSPWKVDTSVAVAFAIGTHAMAIALHILLGLCAAWAEGVGLARLSQAAQVLQLEETPGGGAIVRRNVD